jgi:hypothetical protein
MNADDVENFEKLKKLEGGSEENFERQSVRGLQGKWATKRLDLVIGPHS